MITVNCTSLPANLIESELFGREKGAFTGAQRPADGALRAGRRRHHLSRRNRRNAAGAAMQAAPGHSGRRVRATGQSPHHQGQCADHRGQQPESGRRDPRRQVPARSVLPAQRVSHHHPALAAAQGRHPAARQLFCRQIQQENRQEDRHRVTRDPRTPFRNTTGPATCGSWKMSSSGRSSPARGPHSRYWTGSIRSRRQGKLAGQDVKALADLEHDHILQVLQNTGWRIEGEKGAAILLGINPSTLRARMRKYGIRRQ